MANGYQIVTLKDSAWEDVLKLSPLGTPRRRYYDAKMRDYPSTRLKTQQDMIEVTLSEPKTLMWETGFYVAEDDRLKALSIRDSYMTHAPFAYQRDSEFHGLFNYHLLKMKQSGIFDKILSNYLPDPPITIGISEVKQLGYNNLVVPVIVLSFGCFGGLMILLVERMFRYAFQARQAINSSRKTGSWAKD